MENPVHQQRLTHTTVSRDKERPRQGIAGQPQEQLPKLEFAAHELVFSLKLVIVPKGKAWHKELDIVLRRRESEMLVIPDLLFFLGFFHLFL